MPITNSNEEIKENTIINRVLGRSKMLSFPFIPTGTFLEIKIIKLPKEYRKE